MKNLTTKAAKEYILNEYGYFKHDIKQIVQASRETAKKYKCSPSDVFFFIIDDEPIKKLCTHSYGFHTSGGREVKQTFRNNYYE
jgi:hypothetical protein